MSEDFITKQSEGVDWSKPKWFLPEPIDCGFHFSTAETASSSDHTTKTKEYVKRTYIFTLRWGHNQMSEWQLLVEAKLSFINSGLDVLAIRRVEETNHWKYTTRRVYEAFVRPT